LNSPKNNLDLELDMQTRWRFFFNLCNYQAQKFIKKYFHLIRINELIFRFESLQS